MQLNRIDMLFDCAIIGGGPAALNAALILGRARRNAGTRFFPPFTFS